MPQVVLLQTIKIDQNFLITFNFTNVSFLNFEHRYYDVRTIFTVRFKDAFILTIFHAVAFQDQFLKLSKKMDPVSKIHITTMETIVFVRIIDQETATIQILSYYDDSGIC